jgi:NADPH:quinone reductase-like Zn-dependent oxidoreductase
MKAFTKSVYGGPEVLKLEEVEKPQVQPNQLIVEVKANSPNPADWHILRGEPRFARLMFGLFKPKQKILGADFAGVVVEVGAGGVWISSGGSSVWRKHGGWSLC